MLKTNEVSTVRRERTGSCDIRVWSGECDHTLSPNNGEKYLCEICGTVPKLDHEVMPSALCYISGEYDKLS